ncbi:beclin [Raphidocelis subcapitata]|uniref:Beclin n=1 Tax=Raphidocelis subcapitata TaxID=307507 RepID=A0A2V0P885_9CHLO|nr:beclin [Raphidocelis subcapitata]|eukprot:GBF96056.1 beclin [Raphidocelis subcapitata]
MEQANQQQQQQQEQQAPPQQQATFHCQACRARLDLRGDADAAGERRGLGPAALVSALEGGAIDESFIVLDSAARRGGAPPGVPPSVAAARGLEESFVVLGAASILRPGGGAPAPGGRSGGGSGDGSAPPSTRGSDPSGGAAATAARSPREEDSAGPSPRGGPGPPGGQQAAAAAAAAAGFDGKLQSLTALFEMASSATGVDHPLCLDCAVQLREEVEAQVRAARSEIAAYSRALAELEQDAALPMGEAEFQAQLSALRAEEGAARVAEAELTAQLEVARREGAALAAVADDVAALEERYWHGLNDYSAMLGAHISERDSLLTRIEAASARLALLKGTNVLNDVFRIWHDGPFGTINGCRLGRTPEVPVEWDEINAAWGQAVLLLHTMAQSCQITFSSYRLLPMGSHPRVADRRGTYDLFGPVSKLWAQSYDRAMAIYLACLREFGDFARARDIAESRSPAFEFPFPIDADKVGNYSVKLFMQTKDAKWTKALKLMLADLKVSLQWMVRREARQAAPALPTLGQEGPAA